MRVRTGLGNCLACLFRPPSLAWPCFNPSDQKKGSERNRMECLKWSLLKILLAQGKKRVEESRGGGGGGGGVEQIL